MLKNIFCLWLIFFTVPNLKAQAKQKQSFQKQPNIIVVLADDLGWADLGIYGSSFYETPVLDSLAKNGYQTFFAGKWHLGEDEKYWPQYQGFETNKGGWSKGGPTGRKNDSIGGFFTPYQNPFLKDGPQGEYLTDRLTNECIQFLENKSEKPFFLMYSMYAVHNPLQAPRPLIEKYQQKQKQLSLTEAQRFAKDEEWMKLEAGWKRRLVQDNPVYAAMIENMDWKGRLMSGNTIDIPVTIADLYPTLGKLMVMKYQKNPAIDGEDIFSLFEKKIPERAIYWHYPHYSNQGGKPGAAFEKGSIN